MIHLKIGKTLTQKSKGIKFGPGINQQSVQD